MTGIERLFGSQFNGVTPLNKLNKSAITENVNFKSNPVQLDAGKKLNPDTLVGLKQLAQGVITQEMADDLLATPYVSLDFNG